jgi:hypothetical protein
MTFKEMMVELKISGQKSTAEGDLDRAAACIAIYNVILEQLENDPWLADEEFDFNS